MNNTKEPTVKFLVYQDKDIDLEYDRAHKYIKRLLGDQYEGNTKGYFEYYDIEYPPIQEVVKELTADCINDSSYYKLATKTTMNGFDLLRLPKGTILYKGMRDFLDAKHEKKYYANNDQIRWYGDKYIAFKYAKRYNGAVNAYKLNQDVLLFDYYNYENLDKLFSYLDTKIKKGDRKYVKVMEALVTKTGLHTTLNRQALRIIDYRNWFKKGASQQIFPISGKKSLKKMYCKYAPSDERIRSWGKGYIDRILHNFIMEYSKSRIDSPVAGMLSRQHDSIFARHTGVVPEELIIYNSKYLDREESNPMDWLQWQQFLPVKFNPQFVIDSKVARDNSNFKQYKFYYTPSIHLPSTSNPRIVCFNLNRFRSINTNDSSHHLLHKLTKFISTLNPDVVVLLQANTKVRINLPGYPHKLSTRSILLLSKNSLSPHTIKASHPQNSPLVKFTLKGTTVIAGELSRNTPLSFRDTDYHVDKVVEIVKQDTSKRIRELSNALKHNPDIILGTFHFVQESPEIDWLKSKGFTTPIKNTESSVPGQNVKDWVFHKNTKTISHYLLPCNISIHKPLVVQIN